MKRLLIIPVMFLYLLAVSGVMIHVHYCGQVLESWSVYFQAEGCAEGDCGDESEQPDSCCKDKLIASKVSQDQQFADMLKLKLSAFAAVPAPTGFQIVFSESFTGRVFKTCSNLPNAPPGLWQDIPLYKLHSSLTYYG